MDALTSRGIPENQAHEILKHLAPEQPLWDQLEYVDQVVQKGTIENPTGFRIAFLRENRPIPPHFVSSQQREVLAERDATEERVREEQREAYETYKRREVERYIEENDLQNEYEGRLTEKIEGLRQLMPKRADEELVQLAEASLRDGIAKEIPHFKSEQEFFEDEVMGG